MANKNDESIAIRPEKIEMGYIIGEKSVNQI